MYFASEFVYFSAAGAMLSAAVTGLANSPYYRPQIDSNNRDALILIAIQIARIHKRFETQ
ncbi:hypothetical protein PspLS_10289 [Pyricularia sp. CBS 133598]|nr:hypothetical protein PspLS_10289 [Pyricularia sp. CBS 133598]